VRTAYTLRAEDSDFGQAGTLYRDVFSLEAKARFLETLSGQARAISIDEIRERFFQYWTNVDSDLGTALRAAYAAGVNAEAPQQPEADEDVAA
jgi:catalase